MVELIQFPFSKSALHTFFLKKNEKKRKNIEKIKTTLSYLSFNSFGVPLSGKTAEIA